MVMTVTTSTGNRVTMYCLGSLTFVPSEAVKDEQTHKQVLQRLAETNDFATAIRTWFHLSDDVNAPEADEYVYHAIASVKLSQVQRAVDVGGAKGMHGWYRLEGGDLLPPPPQADIESYISIFLPSTATASALTAFQSNAKRSSIRLRSATYLLSKRYIASDWHPLGHQLIISKTKKDSKTPLPCNPYFDFWAWSCRNLEWCGPVPISSLASSSPPASNTTDEAKKDEPNDTTNKIILTNPRMSHHILPIFMHHFGCAVPSHESLSLLKLFARGRSIIDMGSGNGYWTFMLRQYLSLGPTTSSSPSSSPSQQQKVYAVDNNQSEWRVMWIDDTIIADGVRWLSSPSPSSSSSTSCPSKGGQDMVLLLVYPIVGGDSSAAGGKEGGFTRELMKAYKGDTLAVVGTQNGNGYTGFKGVTMDEYMEREWKDEGWRKVAQCPLPSFAGKDEALFVFQRGEALGNSEEGLGAGSGKAKKKKRKSGKKKDAEVENQNGEDQRDGKEEEEAEEKKEKEGADE
ncbi:uncharacterized protein B0T23DRAFT_185246 [Neurospora hispaniola]|uniref:Uncharacterized protein n=1 Tax=Neurospora hispaniola TaxID=588809 RepID=A0AAJ0I2Z6_9PEZI|nr:hypothetical protein B0T23DRAFT_185246 [Neurospora hispaniola]